MIEYKLSLASSGAVKTPGSMDALQLGYSRNCGVYRLRVSTADEWKGMTLRAFWHTPGGSPPASLVEDGVVEVPALVTAVPGEGCITFEGSDGVRTLTSADLRYRVAANSGTEDGTLPPPGTPAWQRLVGQMEEAGADAEKSAARAETAQSSASDSAAAAARSLKTLQEGIASGSFKGEKGDPGVRGAQGPKGDTGPQGRPAPPVRPARKARGARRARRERRWRWMPPSPCQAQRQMPRPSAARWPERPLPAILTATPVLPRRAVRPTVSTDSPLRPRRPTPVQAAALPPTRCSSCMCKGGRRWQRGSMWVRAASPAG